MKQPLKADSPTKLRVACLDGLRPLLIFWVISFHWEPTGTTAKPWPTFLAPLTWTVDRVQRRAWIACDCFFVLSGFVAAMGKGGRSVAAGRERLTFLWRGIARLAPCYYVSLAWWVLALFLHDVKVKNYGRYQSDASKYDSVDLRTLHGSGFPLTLLMLQSWWPVFERDSSAHPYHSHKWQPEPHGVVFVPCCRRSRGRRRRRIRRRRRSRRCRRSRWCRRSRCCRRSRWCRRWMSTACPRPTPARTCRRRARRP